MSNEWIEWNGGECPVEKGALIDVKRRNGQEHSGNALRWEDDLEQSFWDNDNAGGDIIAYRLHKPEQPAAPLTEQLRKAIAKRDKQSDKAKRHAERLEQREAEVQRLIGELEREIEEMTGLVCTIHHKQKGGIPDSSIPVGVQVHSDIPEGVDPGNPATWKAGDIIQCIELNGGIGVYTVGKEYIVYDIDTAAGASGMYLVRSIDDEGDCMWGGAKFRFVRRPS